MLKMTGNIDADLMRRCIALAKSSVAAGEYPFAAVIARNGKFLCESINRARQDHEANRHAEVVAISMAQAIRGADLSDCTIYSTVEPCAQCSYAIRETQIGRVVYGLRSPLMGGHTRWNILSDTELSDILPEVFLPAPEIVPGFLQNEVEMLFEQWSPPIWYMIRARGIFVSDDRENSVRPRSPHGLNAKLARFFITHLIDRMRQARDEADGDANVLPRK